MEKTTYSLKCDRSNSQEYYETIREFTNSVWTQAETTLVPIAAKYREYLKLHKLEPLREMEEYVLELLSFGVLWNVYAETALAVKHAPFITMAHLAEWRKKHQRAKPYIDVARGIVTTLCLLPEPNSKLRALTPSLEKIDHVCKWFEATGEFKEQALRFILWRAFWQTKAPAALHDVFYTIGAFAEWFEIQAVEKIGKYTENVESFRKQSGKQYRWREDRISCMRSRVEYHLNMVGAELMNRAFRRDYEKTETKVVLLPGCMRAHVDDGCKAERVQEGLLCAGCQPDCRVNQIKEMGKKKKFAVYVIPHASDLSLWGPRPGQPTRGVVASACVTTLVEGGWELKRYDVPAQCVLLDSSGCKKHWHREGFATQLNLGELRRLLNPA